MCELDRFGMDGGYSIESSERSTLTDNGLLSVLVSLVQSDPELGPYRFNEEFLLMFLRCGKTPEKACKRLRNYVKRIKQRPEIFYWNSCLRTACESGVIELSREKGRNCRILIVRTARWNPDEVSPEEIFQMVILVLCLDKSISKDGIHLVFDCSGVNFHRFHRFGPSNLKLVAHLADNSLPVKVKKVHIVHENTIVSMALNFLKQFMSKKLQNRIQIHGSKLDELHKCCFPRCLSKELGGTMSESAAYSYGEYMKKLDGCRHILEQVWEQFH